jgi:phospholipase C
MGAMSRRRFLQGGAAVVGGLAASTGLSASAKAALASVAPADSTLRDIEHVVIFMQENRSFDHYFGTLSGVIGFDDPHAHVDPLTGRSIFQQPDPFLLDGAGGSLLPWHLDTKHTSAQVLYDIDHIWQTQHLSVAGGANDGWLTAHIPIDTVNVLGGGDLTQLTAGGSRTMGYFTRADLPFHYALADAFTICDRYFCSVIGPTLPNRHYLMSATIDPEGAHGGPDVNNLKTSGLSWTTYPERLQAAGIDWYLYREVDDYGDNVLDFFVQYGDPRSELHRRGRSTIAPGKLIPTLREDVVRGNLPQVAWIVGPEYSTEHPDHLPADGAHYLQGILEALTADPKVWAKTLLILDYDENGGFFDHVVPPLAPPGTPGEYLTAQGLANAPEASGIAGPIGLGPRVPAMLISPFTRGGYVCSETFDHTSVLRLLETRFGVEVPNLSAWRRATCADLSLAIGAGATADLVVPTLPDTLELLQIAKEQAATLPAPKVPAEQVMPRQEPGTRPRVRAAAARAATPAVVRPTTTTTPPTTAPPAPGGGAGVPAHQPLPRTGGRPPTLAAAAAMAAGLAVHRLRTRAAEPTPTRGTGTR